MTISISFLTHEFAEIIALNNGVGESFGRVGDTSVKKKKKKSSAITCETTQYNIAKFSQSRQNMAAPMRRKTAREKVMNSVLYHSVLMAKLCHGSSPFSFACTQSCLRSDSLTS